MTNPILQPNSSLVTNELFDAQKHSMLATNLWNQHEGNLSKRFASVNDWVNHLVKFQKGLAFSIQNIPFAIVEVDLLTGNDLVIGQLNWYNTMPDATTELLRQAVEVCFASGCSEVQYAQQITKIEYQVITKENYNAFKAKEQAIQNQQSIPAPGTTEAANLHVATGESKPAASESKSKPAGKSRKSSRKKKSTSNSDKSKSKSGSKSEPKHELQLN